MPTINEIILRAEGYLSGEDLTPLRKAHEYAAKIHANKKRLSGEPYLAHLLSVTYTLSAMRLDLHSLMAGLLHGVLKEAESPAAVEQEIKKLFGKDVAGIVKGATKIDNVHFSNQVAYQAENIRKMFLAMSTDIRVLLIKLADRFDDMKTLRAISRKRQIEVAQETLDLYAPLASRLGIDWMKRELEDLTFEYLHPAEFADLAGKIETSLEERQQYVDEVKAILYDKLHEFGINDCHIMGRPKHLYSIYNKLIVQNIPLEKVYDKVAFRIILKSVNECYAALGLVHSLWTPVEGRFKDFISKPKPNGYRCVHTSVVGLAGEFMEIQIRTEEMDEIAKEGLAAHWAYKEGRAISKSDVELFKWLKQMVQSLHDLKEPQEFLEAVKTELESEQVYVLTPNGEVREIVLGSTPLDFAYNVHTEVGNHCVGAKVNGRLVPLKYELKNGDQVEILTSNTQHPNPRWLSLVKTGRAKSRIRQWLNREEQEKNLNRGQELCERELRKNQLNLKKLIKGGHLREIMKSFNCNSLEDLMRGVGSGRVTVDEIIKRLLPEEIRPPEEVVEDLEVEKLVRRGGGGDAIVIDGINDVMVRISNCCMPVPGDDVMGFITAGRGISVHKVSCSNFRNTDPARHVPVEWGAARGVSHRAQLTLIVHDQKGMLAELSSSISSDDANILSVEAQTSDGTTAQVKVVVEIADRPHLDRLLQHIRQVDGVIEARRG